MNGCFSDNGLFAVDPLPLTFSGDIVAFPVVASADASGTWTIVVMTSSKWHGDTSNPDPVTNLISGTVVVSGNACNANADCDDLNVCTNDICTDGLCSNVNNTVPCDDNNVCTTADVCGAGVCAGTDTSAVDCDDGNVCTTDTCNSVTGCASANNTVACDDGNQCTISDVCAGGTCNGAPVDCSAFDDPCNTASCDTLAGPPANCDIFTPVADDTACDNTIPCTGSEVCTAGACAGTLLAGCETCITAATCTDDLDPCTDNLCTDGTCQYPLNDTCPTLRLNADQACYDLGLNNTVTVAVDMAGMAGLAVVAGQFFVEYDATHLTFLSADPGDTPFVFELFESTTANEIDYAVFANLGDPGTSVDTTMASFTLQAIQECTPFLTFRPSLPGAETNVGTFGDLTPTNPILVDMGAILIDETAPVLTIPADISLHSDAGACGAVATWTPPTATDNCLGSVPVSCTSAPSLGLGNGSVFPVGTTTMTCTTSDSCGNTTGRSFDVTVCEFNELFVDVELLGVRELFLSRCLTFEFSRCGTSQPVEIVSKDIAFSGDGVANVQATAASILVACGAYDCVTARDRLHTLRQTASDFTDDGTTYSATFTGDPTLGGNWLVGGNLNDSDFIDIVDFAAFTASFGFSVGANTDCGTPAPHPDISGNGGVGIEDFTFIIVGFGESSAPACCAPGETAAFRNPTTNPGPIMRISLRDAREQGIQNPEQADLNNDGWIDQKDIAEFLKYGNQDPQPTNRKNQRQRGIR